MTEITELDPGLHEALYRVSNGACGLLAFIAIHSTRLGPAAGGLRMRGYADEAAAVTDALRLSEGMTYKNAAADLPLGGGKAVIVGHPAIHKSPELLRAFGDAVQRLDGRYWTAEDMGMTPRDMAEIALTTRFVAGLPNGTYASGDPSPVTARGVLNAIRIGLRHRTGNDDLTGRRVTVQGLGHVGWNLCSLLRDLGAHLAISDIDDTRKAKAAALFDAEAILGEMITRVPADVHAPCAIGGTLTGGAIFHMSTVVVAGAANNQLPSDEEARQLHERGILYVPDFIANGGGIINVAAEICQIEARGPWVERKLEALSTTLDAVLTAASDQKCSPHFVAMEVVLEKLGQVQNAVSERCGPCTS